MKVSFDYDGTWLHIHHLVERFQLFGDEIFIVTSRDETKPNTQLIEDVISFGIKRENIHFTNHQIKLPKLEQLGIQLHFDDDEIEVNEINMYSESCKALLVNFKHNYGNE